MINLTQREVWWYKPIVGGEKGCGGSSRVRLPEPPLPPERGRKRPTSRENKRLWSVGPYLRQAHVVEWKPPTVCPRCGWRTANPSILTRNSRLCRRMTPARQKGNIEKGHQSSKNI